MLGVELDAALDKASKAPSNVPGQDQGKDQGPRWNPTEHEVLEANIAARRPFLDFVYSLTKPDGSRQYLMVSGEPIFDSTGRFTGYRGIGKDVTETMLPNYEPLPNH